MNKVFVIFIFFLSANLCRGQDLWEYAKVPNKYVSFKIPIDCTTDSVVYGDTHIYSWKFSDFYFSFDVYPWTKTDDTILFQNIDSLEVLKFENILCLMRNRTKIKFSSSIQIGNEKLYYIRYKTFFSKKFLFIRKQSSVTSIFLFLKENYKCRLAISCIKHSNDFRNFYVVEKRFMESIEFR